MIEQRPERGPINKSLFLCFNKESVSPKTNLNLTKE